MRSFASRLPFPLLLAVRTHLSRHRLLSLITLGAVSMSVALATGLEIASRSVERELVRTADELAGASQLEVSAGDLGVPEAVLESVQAVPGVLAAVPFVSTAVRIEHLGAPQRSLELIGVDLLSDQLVRDYSFGEQGITIEQPLRLLAKADSILMATSLARELGLEAGDPLPVRSARGDRTLRVRGFLAPGGVADVFGGQVAVMDVYALQRLFAREGWFDRIDVVVDPAADAVAVRASIADAVAGRATVRRSATRDHWIEATLGTVRLVVWSLVTVTILVAALLAYGATALFVERRATELALLRAAGLESGRVERLLFVDTLLLGTLGAALGVAIGLVLSRSFVGALSSLTSLLDGVEIERLHPSAFTPVLALGVGLTVALLGSLGPARAAARRPPLEVLAASRGPEPLQPPGFAPWRWGLFFALATAWLAVALVPLRLPALTQVALLLGLGLVLLFLAACLFLRRAFVRGRPVLEFGLRGLGRLVGGSLLARPARTGLTIAAVSGVLAAVTMSGVLSRSLTRTLDEWTAAQYPGGIMVTAGSALTVRTNELVAPDTIRAIRETEGVEEVFESYASTILYEGEEVLLAATSMDVMARRGHVPAIDSDPAEVARAIADGQVAISDAFARRFDKRVGDAVTLDTPRGPRTFRVAGVLRDYAGPSGSINIQIDVYDSLWHREGARNLVVWTQGPAEPVMQAIRHRIGDQQTLFFVHGEALLRYVSQLLGRFAVLLDVVAGLTALLGGFAVLNLLLGAVMERRREFALLRSAGATSGQITGLVMADGLLAGLLGGLSGMALGLACAWPMVHRVLPEAYGWTLNFSPDPSHLAMLVLGVSAASVLAGLYPALEALRVVPREIFAPE
jgi:putative ABC transport system permease protein